MKEKVVFGVVFLFLVTLTGMPALYAVEEVAKVYSEDDDGASDPSEFEGDSDSMPGERAPENMPMDDAPVDGAVGVEV